MARGDGGMRSTRAPILICVACLLVIALLIEMTYLPASGMPRLWMMGGL